MSSRAFSTGSIPELHRTLRWLRLVASLKAGVHRPMCAAYRNTRRNKHMSMQISFRRQMFVGASPRMILML